jgi:hypothetical protein
MANEIITKIWWSNIILLKNKYFDLCNWIIVKKLKDITLSIDLKQNMLNNEKVSRGKA